MADTSNHTSYNRGSHPSQRRYPPELRDRAVRMVLDTTARTRQAEPAWQADYRATRPKVERKLGHLMRRRHGGRRARVRGRAKVAADFSLLAATVNLARLGVLGLRWTAAAGWAPA